MWKSTRESSPGRESNDRRTSVKKRGGGEEIMLREQLSPRNYVREGEDVPSLFHVTSVESFG